MKRRAAITIVYNQQPTYLPFRMLFNKRYYSLVLHLAILSLFQLFVSGTDVRLERIDIDVDVGSWAVFNCSVSCDLSKTHTVRWFVGSSRTRLVSSSAKFYQQTGIQVELEKLTSCSPRANSESGVAMYQLRVNATSESVELLNKTSVQCAALRKADIYSDVYSHYGVISINDIQEVATEDEVSTSAQPPIQPTQTVIVTKTVTVTATPDPTNFPDPSRQALCNGTPMRTSSLILTLFPLLLTLTASLFFS